MLWHVEGAANLRGILVGARIATPAESANANLAMGAVYAGFAGLCIALLVYNLALWGALRHRFQLAYCGMLLALMVYATSSSGALAWMWPDIINNDRLAHQLCLARPGGGGGDAVRPQLLRAERVRRMAGKGEQRHLRADADDGRAARDSGAVADPLFDRFFTFVFLAQIGIVVPILWRGWRTRSNYLWMFAIAWAAPIILACFRVAGSLERDQLELLARQFDDPDDDGGGPLLEPRPSPIASACSAWSATRRASRRSPRGCWPTPIR